MKHPMKSKTVRTAITMLTASLTTLCLYYSSAVPLDATALGAAWSGAISSVLMIWLRYMTSEPIKPATNAVQDEKEKP